MYRESYLQRLKRRREEIQRRKDATPKPPTLEQRIEAWFETLSDFEKQRPWTMDEFKEIFGETPQKLGAALFNTHWSRRRAYKDSAPTVRQWLKK